MLKTIHLHGALKKFSDEPFEMDVHDNADVFSALKSRFSEFKKFMWDHPHFHIVLCDKGAKNPRPVYPEFFGSPFNKCDEIHLFPATEGAGIESAFVAWLVEAGMSYAVASIVASVVINVAVAIVLGAVAQMLAPQVETNGSERPDQKPSFLFNGPENVTEQGYQVPIVYGTHMTGSVVVSAGVTIEQLPIESARAPAPSGVEEAIAAALPGQWDGTVIDYTGSGP